jgi:type III pantothenate kinase
MSQFPLMAVDIGNARIKLGCFPAAGREPLPEPERTLPLAGDAPQLAEIAAWLADLRVADLSWWIASVNRPAATQLLDWLRSKRPQDRVTLLAAGDLPLVVRLERPDMVGVDRLLDAVAANALRTPHRPAVVVDVGTAITVDLISPDGEFLGGAILPGIGMSARALHEFTDLLPAVEMAEPIAPPPALGTATVAALRAGLFWGAVGGIRELIERLTDSSAARPQVFLTGGAGPALAAALGAAVRHVPHLTLAGIAIAARAGRR